MCNKPVASGNRGVLWVIVLLEGPFAVSEQVLSARKYLFLIHHSSFTASGKASYATCWPPGSAGSVEKKARPKINQKQLSLTYTMALIVLEAVLKVSVLEFKSFSLLEHGTDCTLHAILVMLVKHT